MRAPRARTGPGRPRARALKFSPVPRPVVASLLHFKIVVTDLAVVMSVIEAGCYLDLLTDGVT